LLNKGREEGYVGKSRFVLRSLGCAHQIGLTEFLNVRKIPLQAMRYKSSSTSLEEESQTMLSDLRKAVLTDRDLHDRVRTSAVLLLRSRD